MMELRAVDGDEAGGDGERGSGNSGTGVNVAHESPT